MLTLEQFNALVRSGYNRIALTTTILADLETPLSAYLKLTQGQRKRSCLLESVVEGERFGRYSFIGLHARSWIESTGSTIHQWHDDKIIATHQGNPLDFIADLQKQCKVALPANPPRFCGGLAGYMGYDMVRHIEPRLAQHQAHQAIGTPEMMMMHTEELAVFDNLQGTLQLIVYADPAQNNAYDNAKKRLEALHAALKNPLPDMDVMPSELQTVQRPFDKAHYLAAVARAKEYIMAGDMMQVQIGQRLETPFHADPIHLYRALRTINPSPYMYYYDMGDFQIVGSSPEILVRQESENQTASNRKKVVLRPIAGTRKRGATTTEDLALEADLLADPKERAEHLMLIDLARNDLGRISKIGTVQVTESFTIERYSHVMHIVSNVEGELQDGLSNIDVLKATFPAGTLTGAPKVRAMEIIDELEVTGRGIYGGACGYLSYAGDMDVAIAIRTGIVKNHTLYAQASAGIVADSVAQNEWQETEIKASALLRAAERVANGLKN